MNAGTRTGNSTEPGTAADLTYAAGSWVNGTRVFTVASGNPQSDGVAVNDYVALDTGGSTAAYVARVSARTTTTITLSASGMGTNPADGTYTLRVGGAWAGPSGASGFPLDQTLTGAGLLNASSDRVRVNLKNDQTYSVTAGITMASGTGGGTYFQGYTSSYGDGGLATIDGGTSGASYSVLSPGTQNQFFDLTVSNNGATGSANGVAGTTPSITFTRCVLRSFRGSGASVTTGTLRLIECEVYDCNQSNTSGLAGATITSGTMIVERCVIHDNAGGNSDGVRMSSSGQIVVRGTVFDTNGGDGVNLGGSGVAMVSGCSFYNNTGTGVAVASTTQATVSNSLFVSNGAYGVAASSAANGRLVALANCAFYSNTSGPTNNLVSEQVAGSVTLSGSPFVDAANGDFDLNNTAGAGAACRGAGRGTFTQTAASYTGTLGYPDIGASQSQASGGSSGMLFVPGLDGV